MALAVAVWPAHTAWAEDETDDLKIEVTAPLEAVDCAAMPPTIGVLGLTIDVGAARFDGDDEDGDDDGEGHDGGDDAELASAGAHSCAELAVGQSIEVKLASDVPDPMTALLSATEIEVGHGELEIRAPLQAVDPNAQSVTVLGLLVDVSHAELEGDDGENDDDAGDDGMPLDLAHLMVGQAVELELVSSTPPLAASKLEVKNHGNEVEVHVERKHDGANDAADDDEVEIDVVEKVVIHAAAAPGKPAKKVKKIVTMHATGSGDTIRLAGLPTGKAKLTVTRGELSGHKSVKVKPNERRVVKVRIR